MHDSWIEQLSDHVDGLLSESAARELDLHLKACADCRSIETDLRAVVAAAHAAPAIEPRRDLWAGIAARLDVPSAVSTGNDDPAAETRPDRVRSRAASPAQRRFTFSMPQLAAAAVVLMAVSGTAVWLISNGDPAAAVASGTIIQSAGDAPRSTRNVSATALPVDYREDVAALELALEQNSAQLDPGTVEVIERSLETINGAIADARAAIAADPGNPYLLRQLDNTMRKKIDVLRRATAVQRAQS